MAKSGPAAASIRRVFMSFVRRRCMAGALALVLSLGLLLFAVVSVYFFLKNASHVAAAGFPNCERMTADEMKVRLLHGQ